MSITVRLMLGGASVITGFLLGELYAKRLKREHEAAAQLLRATKLLKTAVCGYSHGLGEGLSFAISGDSCKLFEDMRDALESDGDLFGIISTSQHPAAIKNVMAQLVRTITVGSAKDIALAFEESLQQLSSYTKDLGAAYKQNAAMYRKLGVLAGVGVFILLI